MCVCVCVCEWFWVCVCVCVCVCVRARVCEKTSRPRFPRFRSRRHGTAIVLNNAQKGLTTDNPSGSSFFFFCVFFLDWRCLGRVKSQDAGFAADPGTRQPGTCAGCAHHGGIELVRRPVKAERGNSRRNSFKTTYTGSGRPVAGTAQIRLKHAINLHTHQASHPPNHHASKYRHHQYCPCPWYQQQRCHIRW